MLYRIDQRVAYVLREDVGEMVVVAVGFFENVVPGVMIVLVDCSCKAVITSCKSDTCQALSCLLAAQGSEA